MMVTFKGSVIPSYDFVPILFYSQVFAAFFRGGLGRGLQKPTSAYLNFVSAVKRRISFLQALRIERRAHFRVVVEIDIDVHGARPIDDPFAQAVSARAS